MINREKTIRDLESIGAWHTHHYEPFHYECAETIHNALELLKEQEPVKPNKPGTAYKTTWSCGVCSYPISTAWVACPSCGRVVKWDD